MKIIVRPADLQADRAALIETLSRYLTPSADGSRFDWLYRGNPHGEARSWLAYDGDSHTIVGAAAAFPRRMYVGGREELGWVLGDFCINDQYRSLGPALQLQRACLSAVDSGTVAFCYDFPNVRMMALYKRLGISPFERMLRLAKPLRVDRKVREMVKVPVVARGLSAAGNLLLGLWDRRLGDSETLTVSIHTGECGEEFSALAQEVSGRYGVCVQRSAAYLNWRYLASTYCHYELLTVRRDGVLVAYSIFSQTGEDGTITDLFGIDDPRIITVLVEGVVALFRERGVVAVSVPILESHPWVPLLHRLGFRAREASPVVVYVSPGSQLKRRMIEGTDWFLMYGDRDS